MGLTLKEIAEELKNTQRKVQLIYAFNSTGKTRLSREFKELVKSEVEDRENEESNITKILYYNALTEDLFYWDNDLESDIEPKLLIRPNSFTDWILKEQGQDQNIISNFQKYTNDKLTPLFDENFTKVSFSIESGDEGKLENVKISKGEESCFVWSVFYTLLDQVINIVDDEEADEKKLNEFENLRYVFIDDPVTSLDENHLIELAIDLSSIIKQSDFDRNQIKFIITTHNPLFYNVLYNELKQNVGFILIRNDDGTFELNEKRGDSNRNFSYHLFLIELINKAIKNNDIQKFHFMLLRNLYEKTAAFLGYKNWSDLLPSDSRKTYIRYINTYSHRTLSNEEISEPSPIEKNIVGYLLNHLIENYNFSKMR